MPPQQRRRWSASERSEQLLDVAEGLLMEHGFDGTTIEEIARTAGVTRPIVYEHHGSKEGVYLACLARARRRLVEEYAAALEGRSEPREVIRASAEVWFSVVDRDPRRWMLLFGTSVPLTPDLAEKVRAEQERNSGFYRAGVRRWARPEVSDDRVAVAAQMIAMTGGQLAQWWLSNRHIPVDEIVEYFTDFCWHGLRPLLPDGDET
ncbi:MAG: TetR/AcrR family transcriptional regulator [Microthrixaceae bacterium]